MSKQSARQGKAPGRNARRTAIQAKRGELRLEAGSPPAVEPGDAGIDPGDLDEHVPPRRY